MCVYETFEIKKKKTRFQNCRGNTAGPRCDICADSFYGHADFGCKPCPCPQVDKRFSSTCTILANTEPICICKPGS